LKPRELFLPDSGVTSVHAFALEHRNFFAQLAAHPM
jgi:hypothetical protein